MFSCESCGNALRAYVVELSTMSKRGVRETDTMELCSDCLARYVNDAFVLVVSAKLFESMVK